MVRATREDWSKRVERWKDSGLTATEFAAEVGISARSLSWWRWRLGSKVSPPPSPARRPRPRALAATTPAKPARPLAFVEITAPQTRESIEVVLGQGRSIRVPVGFDAPTLERLLAVRGSSNGCENIDAVKQYSGRN